VFALFCVACKNYGALDSDPYCFGDKIGECEAECLKRKKTC